MKPILLLLVAIMFSTAAIGQDIGSFPSKAEINELAAKADEKVKVFEEALKAAKPMVNDDTFKNYSDAGATAHLLLSILQKDGPNSYRLVAVVMTLDDLVIDARTIVSNILIDTVQFQAGGKTVPAAVSFMINQLNEAAQACYDINELIGHATLRLINVEEKLIDRATATTKKP